MRTKRIMRSLVMIIACCFLVLPCMVAKADEEDPKIIVIYKDEEQNGQIKVPARIPMYAEYSPTLSSVLVGFRYNVGDVTVAVESDTLGNVYSDVIDSADGGCVILLSGAPGCYTITFTLESGAEYYGEFEI